MSNNNPRYARYRRRALANLPVHAWGYLQKTFGKVVTALTGTASPFSVTATVAGNGLTVTAHGRSVGDGPFVLSAATGTLAGLSTTADYYVATVVDANTITLSTDRKVGSTVAVAAGAGTATLTRRLTNGAILAQVPRKSLPVIKAAADVDNI